MWALLRPAPRVLDVAERRAKCAETAKAFDDKFAGKVPAMSAQQAAAALAAEPGSLVLVDVRNRAEQQVSRIAGPRVLSREEFEAQRESLKDATVVCYCTAGLRSGLYAQQLIDSGLKAANLSGGILAWTQAGLPLETEAGEHTKQVHTYAARFAFHGEGYQPVWYMNEHLVMLQDAVRGLLGRK